MTPGRPPLHTTGAMRRYFVRLPVDLAARLRAAGSGNLSAGIRQAAIALPAPDHPGNLDHSCPEDRVEPGGG